MASAEDVQRAKDEELRLAKEQEKFDREQLDKELIEAGIIPPEGDAPITMKSMIELFGFMKGKMVDEVYTRVSNQNGSSSTASPIKGASDKDKNDNPIEKPSLNFAPPSSYLTQVALTQPHITNLGRPPPKLDNTRYFTWKKSMESYFRSSSVHLWRVVLHGFNPVDPNNLTKQEEIDEQLDANAKYILESAMTANDEDHVRNLKTCNEAWLYLETVYEGNEGIQRSNAAVLQHQVDNFIMLDEETPTELYRRLYKLVVTCRENGKKDMDDEWVKAKFLQAIMPYSETMVMNLHARADYTTMTPNDILAQFVTYDTLKSTSKSFNQVRGPKTLALKARVVDHPRYEESPVYEGEEDLEGELNEVLALAATRFWNKKNKSVNPSPIKRMCFNYGKGTHLVKDCPYERREDNGGQLILKKNKYHPKPTYMKRSPQKALVASHEEEYESGGEEDKEPSEEVGMAALAMGTLPPSLANLFSSPNDDKISKPMCLMAKETKVNSPPKITISSNPSLLDCVEDVGKIEEEDKISIFISKLQGPTKKMVEALMYQYGEAKHLLNEKDVRICELEGHACDHADKIGELEDQLVEEQLLREQLEETHAMDLSKAKETRETSIQIAIDLKSKNEELVESHNKLFEGFEQLRETHKVTSSELTTLKESYAKLQAQFIYASFTTSHNDKDANACSTNPLCVKASLIEENTRLKAQLEKGLASCIQGEKNLNDLLSNQKGVVGKEGIGFTPNSKKVNNKKKKATPPSKDIVFVKEGELAKANDNSIGSGNVTRGNATHNNFAGKYNPSYVLLKSTNGCVFAKYVGSSYGDDYHYAIWVPKTLVTNKRGPIPKWVPKSKT